MDAARKIALLCLVLVFGLTAAAAAQSGRYEDCDLAGDATIIGASAVTCDEARALAAALASTNPADSADALRARGWTPVRAHADDERNEFDLVATRARAAVHIRRPGAAPDLDGWAAGRELIFARPAIVGGGRVPSGAVLCTSSFIVRLRDHPGGLTAAHCGGVRKDGTTQRRNAALRRSPQPGIVLGRVQRNLARTKPLDALVVPVPSGDSRPASDIVDRGVLRPPWFIAGTARSLGGRKVCFTGRTSGVDQCGQILKGTSLDRMASRMAGTKVRCTNITAREGDSGGPVYTAPRADGTVRAVGITTLVFGLLQTMCYTPIEPILDALHATLVTAG